MKTKELIAIIAEKQEMTKKATGEMLDCIIESIIEQVAKGEDVVINGLGKFYALDVPEREYRVPSTGEKTVKPAHRQPKFKATKVFKDAVE